MKILMPFVRQTQSGTNLLRAGIAAYVGTNALTRMTCPVILNLNM